MILSFLQIGPAGKSLKYTPATGIDIINTNKQILDPLFAIDEKASLPTDKLLTNIYTRLENYITDHESYLTPEQQDKIKILITVLKEAVRDPQSESTQSLANHIRKTFKTRDLNDDYNQHFYNIYNEPMVKPVTTDPLSEVDAKNVRELRDLAIQLHFQLYDQETGKYKNNITPSNTANYNNLEDLSDLNDLKALKIILKKASELSENDPDKFMIYINEVFLGNTFPSYNETDRKFLKHIGVSLASDVPIKFSDSGWDTSLKDYTYGQTRHTLSFTKIAYDAYKLADKHITLPVLGVLSTPIPILNTYSTIFPGIVPDDINSNSANTVALALNIVHETIDWHTNPEGKTFEDFKASLLGTYIGLELAKGSKTPEDIANTIDQYMTNPDLLVGNSTKRENTLRDIPLQLNKIGLIPDEELENSTPKHVKPPPPGEALPYQDDPNLDRGASGSIDWTQRSFLDLIFNKPPQEK